MCQWAYNGILSFANVGNTPISIYIYICICVYIIYKYKYKYTIVLIRSFCHLPFELSNCQGGLQCNVLSHFLPHGFHLLLHRLARFFIIDPKRPKGEGGSSSAFIRLGMSWRIFCNGDLWNTENPVFFLKKRWIWLKNMLKLCLKNWGPAEAFAFCPLLLVSPKHSNGFQLSSLQILVSKFDGTFHIHDSHSGNNLLTHPRVNIGVSTPNTVATMIRWSCLFQNDPQSSTQKKPRSSMSCLVLSSGLKIQTWHFSVRLKDLCAVVFFPQ